MTTYNKMDRKIKAKWLAALRSRKFKQTTGQLHRSLDSNEVVDGQAEPGHCCLGVLNEICHLGAAPNAGGFTSVELGRIGLDKEAQDHLINMNDDNGAKFYQIARWIERNL